ncbi:hypothetical protein GCM10010222_74460 [Streptomyces tanashiensis]|nr:hypothetical protein GCM10010222_74460 [Streptomyces tanashiensis]
MRLLCYAWAGPREQARAEDEKPGVHDLLRRSYLIDIKQNRRYTGASAAADAP